MRIPSDLTGRIRLLERARNDAGLRSLLSPEAATAFGAFPLATRGETLVVAVPDWADAAIYPFLGKALGRPVEAVPMEPAVVLSFIARVFLGGEMPNFHTFPRPDFVSEENLPRLVSGKVEPLPPAALDVPPDALLLLDLHLGSSLANLDRYEGDARIEAGDQDVPFSRDGARLRVFGPPLEDEARILLKLSFRYEGMEHRHGFRGARLSALPHVLHPSELQIVGAGADGSVRFWVFDAVRTAAPGDRTTLGCTYHFLNFGNRYRRRLDLEVLEATLVDRETVVPEPEARWTLADFDRWFGAP